MSAEPSWPAILVNVPGGHNTLSGEVCDSSAGGLRTVGCGPPWARDSLCVPQLLSSSSDGASG